MYDAWYENKKKLKYTFYKKYAKKKSFEHFLKSVLDPIARMPSEKGYICNQCIKKNKLEKTKHDKRTEKICNLCGADKRITSKRKREINNRDVIDRFTTMCEPLYSNISINLSKLKNENTKMIIELISNEKISDTDSDRALSNEPPPRGAIEQSQLYDLLGNYHTINSRTHSPMKKRIEIPYNLFTKDFVLEFIIGNGPISQVDYQNRIKTFLYCLISKGNHELARLLNNFNMQSAISCNNSRMTLYNDSKKSRLCLIHNPLSDLSEITLGLTETKLGVGKKTQQKNIAQQISNRIMPKKQNDRQMEKMKLIESHISCDIEHVSPPREKFTKAEKNYYYSDEFYGYGGVIPKRNIMSSKESKKQVPRVDINDYRSNYSIISKGCYYLQHTDIEKCKIDEIYYSVFMEMLKFCIDYSSFASCILEKGLLTNLTQNILNRYEFKFSSIPHNELLKLLVILKEKYINHSECINNEWLKFCQLLKKLKLIKDIPTID